MNNIDLVCIFCLAVYLYRGYKRGFIDTIFVSLRFLIGIFGTHILMKIFSKELLANKDVLTLISPLREFALQKFSFFQNYLQFLDYLIVFLIIFIFVMIVSIIVGGAIKSEVSKSNLKSIDKFLGALLGVIQCIVIMMLIVFLIDKIPDSAIPFEWKEYFSNSIFIKYMFMMNFFINFL